MSFSSEDGMKDIVSMKRNIPIAIVMTCSELRDNDVKRALSRIRSSA